MGEKMLNQLLWTINFMRSLEIPRSDYKNGDLLI